MSDTLTPTAAEHEELIATRRDIHQHPELRYEEARTAGLVAERLREHYRVIAMDARGHGDSSKPKGADCYRWELFGRDVLDVAEALVAEHPENRVALGLGHSFGGTSILMASAARPDHVEHNVLVDPVIQSTVDERAPTALSLINIYQPTRR